MQQFYSCRTNAAKVMTYRKLLYKIPTLITLIDPVDFTVEILYSNPLIPNIKI